MNSSLDLTQLNNLCSLPCVIDSSKSLFGCPILETAERIGDSTFVQEVLAGESLTAFLCRIYDDSDSYDMDCSIYSQLVSLVLARRWPTQGGKISLYISDETGGPLLWESKIPELGYIGSSNSDVSKFLQGLSITFKGQWAIRLDENKFLGLAVEGPKVMSMEEWVINLRSKLEDYSKVDDSISPFNFLSRNSHGASPGNMIEYTSKRLLNLYFLMDKMNKWGFYPNRAIPTVKAKWSPNGITIKYKDSKEGDLSQIGSLMFAALSKLIKARSLMKDLSETSSEPCKDCGGFHSYELPDRDSWSNKLPTFEELPEREPWSYERRPFPRFAATPIRNEDVDFEYLEPHMFNVTPLMMHPRQFRPTRDFESLYPSILQSLLSARSDSSLPFVFDGSDKSLHSDFNTWILPRSFERSIPIDLGIELPKQIKTNNQQLFEMFKHNQRVQRKAKFDNKKQRSARPNVFRMNSGR